MSYFIFTQGGGGLTHFTIDDDVTTLDAQLWLPDTNGDTEWIQIDLFYFEIVVQAGICY